MSQSPWPMMTRHPTNFQIILVIVVEDVIIVKIIVVVVDDDLIHIVL